VVGSKRPKPTGYRSQSNHIGRSGPYNPAQWPGYIATSDIIVRVCYAPHVRLFACRFWPMPDATPAHRSYRSRCRLRAEELSPGHFAVVEHSRGIIVIAGFPSYSAAWTFIANRLLDERDAD